MHIILMVRGINDQFERWKKFMETQMWLWKRYPILQDKFGNFIKDKDGNNISSSQPIYNEVQGALRPIQFFEYVFPETSPVMQNGKEVGEISNIVPVLAMMGNLHKNVNDLRPEAKTASWFVRKSMKLDPIPQIPEEIKKLDRTQITEKMVPMEGMAVYPLGIKKDVVQEYTNYGTKQEGL